MLYTLALASLLLEDHPHLEVLHIYYVGGETPGHLLA
jgi:hypothetical protein